MVEQTPARFPVSDVYCPTPGCPSFRETDHALVCVTASDGGVGVRCDDCGAQWETTAAYFSLLSPWPQVWSGTLLSGAAAVGVWFLPWGFWLQLITSLLSLSSFAQAVQKTRARQRRRNAFVLLSELTLPANLVPDERLEKRRGQLAQLSRLDALRGQKGSVSSWLHGFQTRVLPRIVETQHLVRLCRPTFLETLPARVKRAHFTEEEHRFLQTQLLALQQVGEQKEQLKAAWETDITRLESVVFVLQDLVLTEKGLEQPLRLELAQLLKEGYTLPAVLDGRSPTGTASETSSEDAEEELESLFSDTTEEDQEWAEVALLKSELVAMEAGSPPVSSQQGLEDAAE